MTATQPEPVSAGAAMPAVVGPVRYPRRSRDLEDWEREPIAELGRILRDARLARGLELADLGPVCGSADSLAAIEDGYGRTRADRLRPWLAHLGVDPEPIIAKYSAVIAPPSGSGRPAWRPVAPVPPRPPRALVPPPLEAWAVAALGAELWRMRALAGLSRPALAARLGVSRIHVYLCERGLRQPSAELVDRWLAAAGRPVDAALFALRFPGMIGPRRPARGPRMPQDAARSSRKAG